MGQAISRHCPAPHPSYLALPTVDLETLKTEFQDDSPTSGTVLRGRQLAEADVTSQAWPYGVLLRIPHQGRSASSDTPAQGQRPGRHTLNGQAMSFGVWVPRHLRRVLNLGTHQVTSKTFGPHPSWASCTLRAPSKFNVHGTHPWVMCPKPLTCRAHSCCCTRHTLS